MTRKLPRLLSQASTFITFWKMHQLRRSQQLLPDQSHVALATIGMHFLWHEHIYRPSESFTLTFKRLRWPSFAPTFVWRVVFIRLVRSKGFSHSGEKEAVCRRICTLTRGKAKVEKSTFESKHTNSKLASTLLGFIKSSSHLFVSLVNHQTVDLLAKEWLWL